MRPITSGTTNSPPYASTEISEVAAAELTPSRRPARLKRSGTTGESPAPGSAKAARQKTGFSQKQSIKPAAARHQHTLCEAPPQELADETADNAAAAAKAAKAGVAASNPAPFVIRSKAPPLGRCTFRCISADRHEPEDPDNRRKLETSFGPLFCRMRSCIVNEPGVSTKSTKSVKSGRHRSHFRHL